METMKTREVVGYPIGSEKVVFLGRITLTDEGVADLLLEISQGKNSLIVDNAVVKLSHFSTIRIR